MKDLELNQYIRDAVDDFVNPTEDEEREPLSVELQRSIVVWITFGGPNIWIEIPVDSGNAVIHGAWGSQRADYTLSHDEERAVLESLGIYDIEEYVRYMGAN
jgi:hypothetical protein